ncbi:MAG: histidine kinase [Bacteroidetes bacterium]|nr:histidine kinase [Fibrella sp.]
MGIISFHRSVPLLIHVLVWTVLGGSIFLVHPLSWGIELPTEFWIKQIVQFSVLVGIFYLNAQIFVPRLLFVDRIGWFVVTLVVAIGLMILVRQELDTQLNMRELMHRAFHPKEQARQEPRRPERDKFDLYGLLITLGMLGVSTSIAVVQKWQTDAQIRLALEQEKLASELSFLKAQINPHFFFNTLNNIYALTLIDADTAREALHRLSRMMRYVLYETQSGHTLLSKEIAFVQDYIQLMQLRLTDKVTVTFDPPSPLHDGPIAPMLLLPFIENAFKHGVSAVERSQIYIGVQQHGSQLQVDVRNSLFPDNRPPVDESHGIGLANTRRRLDLLYPNQYTLAVTEHTPENEYRVVLTLLLSDVVKASPDWVTAPSLA